MDVATIAMPANAARRAYVEYRNAVHRGGSTSPASDEALMHSYRVLAQGKRILNVYDAMRVAGVDYQNRPRLAVARADLAEIRFAWVWRQQGHVPMFGKETYWHRRIRTNLLLPHNTFSYPGYMPTLYAQVPSIPPRLRPKHQLHNYHILWEAEWDAPPRDPILMKRVHGLLFAVVAQWDLTEMERSVLGLARLQED